MGEMIGILVGNSTSFRFWGAQHLFEKSSCFRVLGALQLLLERDHIFDFGGAATFV
jgi:hypothetical protein